MDTSMDSSYGKDAVETPTEKTAPDETESVDEANAGATEILIEKAKLPGKKEGDICTFKVVKDFGDELSLEYVKEETPEPAEDNLSANMESDMDAMDQGES